MRILERIDYDCRAALHARLRASNTAASPALARLRDSKDDQKVPLHVWALDGESEGPLGNLMLDTSGTHSPHSRGGPSGSLTPAQPPPIPFFHPSPSAIYEAVQAVSRPPSSQTPSYSACEAVPTISDSDDLVGGLVGHTWAHWLHITYLFVAPAERGVGLGRHLLGQAERIARDRGCVAAIVQTWDFQAPQFYIANGYEVAGKVEGYPPGITDFTLIKHISDDNSVGGVRNKGVSLGVTDV